MLEQPTQPFFIYKELQLLPCFALALVPCLSTISSRYKALALTTLRCRRARSRWSARGNIGFPRWGDWSIARLIFKHRGLIRDGVWHEHLLKILEIVFVKVLICRLVWSEILLIPSLYVVPGIISCVVKRGRRCLPRHQVLIWPVGFLGWWSKSS